MLKMCNNLMVHHKCYTTKPHESWRTWERKMAVFKPINKGGHLISLQVTTANRYPLVFFFDPLDGRLHYSVPNEAEVV